ncbi:MAG: GyrI-like domain-containing protein [Clostridiales bacterium]|nr:GyrI-like domain-containing protein [Clostridiales bacterium]
MELRRLEATRNYNKEFYLPSKTPGIIEVPEMNYVAVRGMGDPNAEGGEYKAAIGLLYGISYTIKMSYKGSRSIDGYFAYVVSPLFQEERGFSKVEFFRYSDGFCVHCMHIGSYDEEPGTIEKMNRYLMENGLENDYSGERFHHEIYLSDPRRVPLERCKTVIRQPVKR